VRLAFELEGDAARKPSAEALPRRALELHVHGVVGQASVAVDLGDLAREHRAGGAVGVLDLGFDPHRGAAVDRGTRLADQLAVEDAFEMMVLRLAAIEADAL